MNLAEHQQLMRVEVFGQRFGIAADENGCIIGFFQFDLQFLLQLRAGQRGWRGSLRGTITGNHVPISASAAVNHELKRERIKGDERAVRLAYGG